MTDTSLEEVVSRCINTHGRITFAEFMALALYSPLGGYYSSLPNVERYRDYFTSPAAHPAFGALIALQLEEMWHLMGCPSRFVVLEPGAGPGLLARDVTKYTHNLHPDFKKSLVYIAIDRYMRHQDGSDMALFDAIVAAGLPFKKIRGCILSNELLDALPVHRIVVRNGQINEIYVTYKSGKFIELEDNPSTPLIEARLLESGVDLAEGQRAEVCLELDNWIHRISEVLEQGFLMTIDYGYPSHELYAPGRFHGTLRCYYRHTVGVDPYIRLGEQDITAHVDITALKVLGAKYGLCAQPLQTQASFLENLGIGNFRRRLAVSGLRQTERDANRMAMLQLTRSGGMGDFRVVIQGKQVESHLITGIHGASNAWQGRFTDLPLPVLGDKHINLMRAKYPYGVQFWDENWQLE